MSFELKWRGGVAYLCGTLNGRRIRKSLGTRDPQVAAHLKAQSEARLIRASIYGEEQEATFADAYILYHKLGKDERGYLGPIIKKLGKLKLKDITPARVRGIAKEIYPDAKPQTWNRYVIVPASAVINNAHQHGLCPPIRIKRFKAVDPRKRIPVTREWIDTFRTAALERYAGDHENLGPRLAAYALFMFTTAARPSEAVELRPFHFKLDERKGESARPTKNGDRRPFYLTEEMADELRRLPATKLRWGKHAGQLRVFGWADCKGPIGPWKEVCKHAGLEYREPYEAGRHSFATEAVTRQERNVVESAKVGNWKDPGVLLKNYAHSVRPGEFAEEVFGSKTSQQHSKNLKIVK